MKKKLLLIQPENPQIHQFRKRQFHNFVQITIPYLAAFIDPEKYELTLVDEYNQKIPYHKSFDLVAITVNTPNSRHCYQISAAFRSQGTKVVMGGPHVTLLPEETAAHCDFQLLGESEDIWPEFLEDFWQHKARPQYISHAVPDLKGIPAPRWDLLKHRHSLMKAAVFATRGCPHHCSYCNLKQIYFDCFRSRPVQEVISEIHNLHSRYFVFWDDNFFANKSYALSLMKAMKGEKKRWAAQVTLRDCADDALLQAAKEAGCLYLFIGLESFSEDSLADADKEINRVQDYAPILKKIHSYGILVQAGIVFGFDSDRKDIFHKTLHACEELGIDGVTASILTPFPKTPLYQQLQIENRLLTEDWSYYNGKTHVTFLPRHMTAEELFQGYQQFRKQFYSIASFIRRMRKSRTNLFYNFWINLGYYLAL